jgi:HindVP restriction endonuclease
MLIEQPGLFGIRYSNRDFKQKESWGKNCFNSSFPASLCAYIHSCNLENIYLKLNSNLKIIHSTISTTEFYGINPASDNLFYAFETQFTPYQKYVIGTIPGVDLVTQAKDIGSCLQGIEIKLTVLPDHTTCELSEDFYGCEIIVRPQTIVYLACGLVNIFQNNLDALRNLIGEEFENIIDWTEARYIIPYIPKMIDVINSILLLIWDDQKPLLMLPIWKTQGKSPKLSDYCLDVFIWSNLALAKLFIDLVKTDIDSYSGINRYARTVVWLFKMIHDFIIHNSFNPARIIDELSYNTKNDKAFAVNGRVSHKYMKSEVLRQPRIRINDIKEIILGGGQNLLSPERRFDAIIYNSPDLFD